MSIQNTFWEYWYSLSRGEADLFQRFLALFVEYNAHTNLSAIRDERGIIEKHFVDSLILERFVSIDNERILDIGSGGGFPGIPLAIRHPEAQFFLLDSVGKKVRAWEHFAKNLSLANIVCLHGRAEDIIKAPLRRGEERSEGGLYQSFDLVLSRATAYLPQILEWAESFLSRTGQIILYKLPSDDELRDGMIMAKRLSLRLVRQEKYSLAGQERVLLFFTRA